MLAQDPEQRRVRLDAQLPAYSVDREGDHAFPPFTGEKIRELTTTSAPLIDAMARPEADERS